MSYEEKTQYYYQRPLSVQQATDYYQELVRECQQKINILNFQIGTLNMNNTTHKKLIESYLDAREKNLKTINACKIYIYGLNKQRMIVKPPTTSTQIGQTPQTTVGRIGSMVRHYQLSQEQKTSKSPKGVHINPKFINRETYVNRKQYHRIIKRREQRERIERLLAKYEKEDRERKRKNAAKLKRRRRNTRPIKPEKSGGNDNNPIKKKSLESEDEIVLMDSNNNERNRNNMLPLKKRRGYEKLSPANKSGIKKSKKTTPKKPLVIEID